MTESTSTNRDPEEVRKDIARSERLFLKKLGMGLLVAAVAGWIYTAYMSSAVSSDAASALDGEPGEQEIKAAFEALQWPHLFSGLERPARLVPEAEPLLEGLDEEVVVEAFVRGDPFDLLAPAKLEWPNITAVLKRTDKGQLSDEDIAAARKKDERLPAYLRLRAKGYDPTLLADPGRLQACRAFAPCVAGVLERRHPDTYNSLVLLHRYARGLAFSERTSTFARRRLAHYIRVRAEAYERGYGTVKGDVEALRALREVQSVAVENGRTMTIFLTVIAIMLLVFSVIDRARGYAAIEGGSAAGREEDEGAAEGEEEERS